MESEPLIEGFFSACIVLANIVIIIVAVYNPMKWQVNVIWEVAALASTILTILLLTLDTLLLGSKRLNAAIRVEAVTALMLMNFLLILLGAISVVFAIYPPWFEKAIKQLPALYDNKIIAHAGVIFLGASIAVGISAFTTQLKISPSLSKQAKLKLEPLLDAEKHHANLAMRFIDFPIVLAFFAILVVIYMAHSGHYGIQYEVLALEYFLSGGITLSLILANTAYILSRAMPVKLEGE